MFSGARVSVSQVDIQCFLESHSRTHLFLVEMLSLVCLQAFQHFMWILIPTTASDVDLIAG